MHSLFSVVVAWVLFALGAIYVAKDTYHSEEYKIYLYAFGMSMYAGILLCVHG